jgi:predicted transposase/invertase (TIGR01784 family)
MLIDEYNEQVRAEYEMHMKAVRDRAWFRNDGYQDGIEKGIEKGMQKGIQDVARRMKSMGLTTEQIITATDLSPEAIEKL